MGAALVDPRAEAILLPMVQEGEEGVEVVADNLVREIGFVQVWKI